MGAMADNGVVVISDSLVLEQQCIKEWAGVLLFPPLTNYHRLLVHKTVEGEFPFLHSFSVGEGSDRRTVVCWKRIAPPKDNDYRSHLFRGGYGYCTPVDMKGRGRGRNKNNSSPAPGPDSVSSSRPCPDNVAPSRSDRPELSPCSSHSPDITTSIPDNSSSTSSTPRQRTKSRRPDVQVYVPRGRRLRQSEGDTTPTRPGHRPSPQSQHRVPQSRSAPNSELSSHGTERSEEREPQAHRQTHKSHHSRSSDKLEQFAEAETEHHQAGSQHHQLQSSPSHHSSSLDQSNPTTRTYQPHHTTDSAQFEDSLEHKQTKAHTHTDHHSENSTNISLVENLPNPVCSNDKSNSGDTNSSRLPLDGTWASDCGLESDIKDFSSRNEPMDVSENETEVTRIVERDSEKSETKISNENAKCPETKIDKEGCDQDIEKEEVKNDFDIEKERVRVSEKGDSDLKTCCSNESQTNETNEIFTGVNIPPEIADTPNDEFNQNKHIVSTKLDNENVDDSVEFDDNVASQIEEVDTVVNENVINEAGKGSKGLLDSNGETEDGILDKDDALENSDVVKTDLEKNASSGNSEMLKLETDHIGIDKAGAKENVDTGKVDQDNVEMDIDENKGSINCDIKDNEDTVECKDETNDTVKDHKDLDADNKLDTNAVEPDEGKSKTSHSKKHRDRDKKKKKKIVTNDTSKTEAKTVKSDGAMDTDKTGETENSRPEDEEEVEESWDAMFDDDGECLNPDAMKELTDTLGNVKIKKTKTINYLDYQPKDKAEAGNMDFSQYDHVIEIYDFPAEFVTRDLIMAFQSFMSRGFDLKWVDDTHALGIFSSHIAARDALELKHPLLKVCPLSQASRQSQLKARRCTEFLQPYKPRPETTAAAARRLVAGALGITTNVSKEKRDKERQQLKEAKDKRRKERKNKEQIWEFGKCAMDEES